MYTMYEVYIPYKQHSHGEPRVSMCKLNFDAYWRNPAATPMFRDLVSMSNCKRSGERSGSLGSVPIF